MHWIVSPWKIHSLKLEPSVWWCLGYLNEGRGQRWQASWLSLEGIWGTFSWSLSARWMVAGTRGWEPMFQERKKGKGYPPTGNNSGISASNQEQENWCGAGSPPRAVRSWQYSRKSYAWELDSCGIPSGLSCQLTRWVNRSHSSVLIPALRWQDSSEGWWQVRKVPYCPLYLHRHHVGQTSIICCLDHLTAVPALLFPLNSTASSQKLGYLETSIRSCFPRWKPFNPGAMSSNPNSQLWLRIFCQIQGMPRFLILVILLCSALVSSEFFKHAKPCSASGPLYILYPLPTMSLTSFLCLANFLLIFQFADGPPWIIFLPLFFTVLNTSCNYFV